MIAFLILTGLWLAKLLLLGAAWAPRQGLIGVGNGKSDAPSQTSSTQPRLTAMDTGTEQYHVKVQATTVRHYYSMDGNGFFFFFFHRSIERGIQSASKEKKCFVSLAQGALWEFSRILSFGWKNTEIRLIKIVRSSSTRGLPTTSSVCGEKAEH